MTSIIVVDDHTIIRQGIAGLLKSIEGFEVIAEAGTGAAGVKLALELKPGLVIMDMSLPDMDGLEAVRQMKEKNFKGEIVFLTMHNDPGLCEAAACMGVRGYLLKDDAMDDLLYAIKAVLRGERFTSGALKDSPDSSSGKVGEASSLLTKREREIVGLIAGGFSSKVIAEKLFISLKTVETHRSNIMQKLGLKCAADVTKYAIKAGLVS